MRFPLFTGACAGHPTHAEVEARIAAAEARIHAELHAKLDRIINLLTGPRGAQQ